MTIQEEIPGTNVRVFVAGERVLACEVTTGEVDFRDDGAPRIVPHELPAEADEMCRTIARTLGLLWTGIDFRLTPDGRYVFLEANPSPMFIGFERVFRSAADRGARRSADRRAGGGEACGPYFVTASPAFFSTSFGVA